MVVAVAEAPGSGRDGVASAPVLIRPDDVEVEIRGAGNATRRIHHIIKPEFPADRLEVVEVYTPAGNWSSWPPHKHDVDDMPNEAVLEEIYYYQQRRPEGWAIQRLYRRERRPARRGVGGPPRRAGAGDRWLSPVRGDPRLRRVLPERAGWRPAHDGVHATIQTWPGHAPPGLTSSPTRARRRWSPSKCDCSPEGTPVCTAVPTASLRSLRRDERVDGRRGGR